MGAHDWSQEEVEAIVADYLQMLTLELSGQKYNKAEHRRDLLQKLDERTEGAVEFKHCNISAVMIELGFPYVAGYQPRSNYQQRLGDVVTAQVAAKPILDEAALAAVERPAVPNGVMSFESVLTPAPAREPRVAEPAPSFVPIKRDYLQRESLNRSLGLAGEEFVMRFEHWRLRSTGKPKLAEKVDHVSRSKGDGLGYDILSYEANGRERLIEVKTTAFGKETPFFVSRGELALSRGSSEQFHLYRVFHFRQAPKLFDLPGPLERHCFLDPLSYRASF